MFESLSSKFSGVLNSLRSRGKISEKDIDTAIGDIKSALLDSDVALEVVESFTENIRANVAGWHESGAGNF
jgi:signal recognition particle subunit SRP54